MEKKKSIPVTMNSEYVYYDGFGSPSRLSERQQRAKRLKHRKEVVHEDPDVIKKLSKIRLYST